MKKPYFADGQIYHIFNRGVEKRTTFLDDEDHYRFIHDLYEFNTEEQVVNVKYYFDPSTMNIDSNEPQDSREMLVDILVYTLMPNHYHLIVRQKKMNGIVKFMQKLGTGYTMYFNQKYERVGGLFQGRFKAALVDEESHSLYLPHYIHANPLSLMHGGSASIQWKQKMQFLENYRWSSFLDYIGTKNFPSVIEKDTILSVFGDEGKYRARTEEWLQEEDDSGLHARLSDTLLD